MADMLADAIARDARIAERIAKFNARIEAEEAEREVREGYGK